MNMWTMIVLIVAIGTFSELYRHRISANVKESKKLFDSISKRVARLEERMANLETIVLEKSREKQFSDLKDD
jgi:hypothetical protein